MATLAEIRARLAAQDNKTNTNSGDSVTYPHWNLKENDTAIVRFLPDRDQDNPFFWVEKLQIRLPFNGVKGGDSKQVTVNVPCMEQWGGTCPVLQEIRPWFNDPSLEDMARKYWKKRSYLFQGFVRTNPLEEDRAPENPIRKFTISPQIFKVIKASLMDPDMENLPTDYENGLDFRIVKTSKGDFADYSTSSWSRKESTLTDAEREAIKIHGLFNLADGLQDKPNDLALKAIMEMFEASVAGEQYDPERWGNYYRPYGIDAPIRTPGISEEDIPFGPTKEAAKIEEKPIAAEVSTAKTEESAPSNKKAEDILAMIRARQA